MSAVLSSDILEQQFGQTFIEVLRQDNLTRIIRTKVVATGQVLEISQVTFIEAAAHTWSDIHRAVIAGQSMGKAFRSRNVEFTRHTKSISHQVPSADICHLFGSDRPATMVIVAILVGAAQILYAEIIETYSPVVCWPIED